MTIRTVSPVSADQVPGVLHLFTSEWWTKDRTSDDVLNLLQGSTATVAIVDDGSMVAFARVLTDRCHLALVLDVIVHPSARGTGLGDQLMNAVLQLDCLVNVSSIELVCQPDKIAFYERHGFSSEVKQSTLMRRTNDPRLVEADEESSL